MNKNTLKQLRLSGRLRAYINFRGSNSRDQSGQGLTVTVPASAVLENAGLRVTDSPVTVQIDMTDVDEFFIFMVYSGLREGLSDQYPLEFSTDFTSVTDGWALFIESTLWANFAYQNTLGQFDARTDPLTVLNQGELGFHVNRKLTNASIKPYNQGILDFASQTFQDNKDGAKFGNHLLHIGARPAGVSKFDGVIHEVGIYTGAPA